MLSARSFKAGAGIGAAAVMGTILLMAASTKINWATQIGNFPSGCPATEFISALGVTPTCGQPIAVLASYYPTPISSNLPISATTLTSVLSQAVTMPSFGCPCRVHASYGLYYSSGGSTNPTIDAYVSDGTNIFATSQTIIPASGETTGMNGTQMSTVTYANSANKTFTLYVESSQAFTVQAAPNSAGQNSWMSVTVYGSN